MKEDDDSDTAWVCLKLALISRVLTITLQAVSNIAIPDHHPDVFRTPGYENATTPLEKILTPVLGGCDRWDSQYFLHIAQYGYTYENTLAFFPLYPSLVYLTGCCLYPSLEEWLNVHTVLLLSGVILNAVFFTAAAVVLYRLSCVVLRDRIMAVKSVCLFCINPASVFFSSCYSESLFSLCAFCGMLLTETGKPFWGAVMFGLSSGTRSNGILYAAFLWHSQLRHLIKELSGWNSNVLAPKIRLSLLWVVKTSLNLAVSVSPFVLFQLYAFVLYCIPMAITFDAPSEISAYSKTRGLVMPSNEPPAWCNSELPLSYSYVQQHYWNVGFLKYYERKQWPNFLLALPVVLIVFGFSGLYFAENFKLCKSLGLRTPKFEKPAADLIKNSRCFVYVVHLVALTTFCLLCIHVQVTTRMIASSSPLLYWIAAWAISTREDDYGSYDDDLCLGSTSRERLRRQEEKKKALSPTIPEYHYLYDLKHLLDDKGEIPFLIMLYFYAYYFLGIVLHSNYLPWT